MRNIDFLRSLCYQACRLNKQCILQLTVSNTMGDWTSYKFGRPDQQNATHKEALLAPSSVLEFTTEIPVGVGSIAVFDFAIGFGAGSQHCQVTHFGLCTNH